MATNSAFNKVYIDISGTCNAKCVWCDRGARKQGLLPPPLENSAPRFMPPDTFGEVVDYLLCNGIITQDATIALHNWGEPLIHPNIHEIFSILKNNSYYKGSLFFSTNGSCCIELDPEKMPSLSTVIFSIPGFSQKSYDFAHKFNFEKTMSNILCMAKDLMKFKNVNKHLSYHIYKHNLNEIASAQIFSRKIHFSFSPVLAFFNSYEFARAYHNNTMSQEIHDLARKSLFLFDYEALKYIRPKKFVCDQWYYLALSHDAQVNLGCCTRLNEAQDCRLGDIRTVSFEDIMNMRMHSPVCQECIAMGLDYSPVYAIAEQRQLCDALVQKWGI